MIAHPTAADRPDWADVDEEILCPLCDYNLRGLQVPRCPECGFTFDWPEVLDPTRRHHRYVFEHHAERNAWSFWKTFLGGLRPRKFWMSLHPAQPSRPRRLIGYWLIVSCFMLLPGAVLLGATAVNLSQNNARMRLTYRAWATQNPRQDWIDEGVKRLGLNAWLDEMAPRPYQLEFWKSFFARAWIPLLGLLSVLYIAWPGVTYVALLIFRWSMRRAKVKRSHVLRCVVYAFDAAVWTGLLSAAAAAVILIRSFRIGFLDSSGAIAMLALIMLASVVLMTYRLCVAYKVYMRFDHSVATVIATQVMYGLIITILSMWASLSF